MSNENVGSNHLAVGRHLTTLISACYVIVIFYLGCTPRRRKVGDLVDRRSTSGNGSFLSRPVLREASHVASAGTLRRMPNGTELDLAGHIRRAIKERSPADVAVEAAQIAGAEGCFKPRRRWSAARLRLGTPSSPRVACAQGERWRDWGGPHVMIPADPDRAPI